MTRRKTPVVNPFAARIAKAISKAKWTQQDIALFLGVSEAAVSQWVSGKRNPTLAHLRVIARHQDVARCTDRRRVTTSHNRTTCGEPTTVNR